MELDVIRKEAGKGKKNANIYQEKNWCTRNKKDEEDTNNVEMI